MNPEQFARWLRDETELSPGAKCERAVHHFELVVDRCRKRHGLAMVLGGAQRHLAVLRPHGNWTTLEAEHYEKAVAALAHALHLVDELLPSDGHAPQD